MQDNRSFSVEALAYVLALVVAALVAVCVDRLVQFAVPTSTPWWAMALLDGFVGAGLGFMVGVIARRDAGASASDTDAS